MPAAPVDRLFAEVLAGPRNLDLLDSLLAADYVDRTAPAGSNDRRAVRPKLEALRAGFSDIMFVLEDKVAHGATVAARWYWRGTHDGPFMGYAATGATVIVRGMDFYRIAGARIAEHWDVVDTAGLVAQLEQSGK